MSMYHTICTILRYDTIYMLCTLYRTIYKHFLCLYDTKFCTHNTYRVSYNVDNYGLSFFKHNSII